MKEVIIEIKEDKYKFFMELIKSFDFVKVRNKPGKKELFLTIAKGMREVQLAEKGKIKARSAKVFLNEL